MITKVKPLISIWLLGAMFRVLFIAGFVTVVIIVFGSPELDNSTFMVSALIGYMWRVQIEKLNDS